jgi:hypothetical protein
MRLILAFLAGFFTWRALKPPSEKKLLTQLSPLSPEWRNQHIYTSGQKGS